MSDQERMELINKLCKTCSRQRLLPKSMHIPDCLNKSSKIRSYGGNADVWESTYKGRRVAVKVLRVSTTDGLDVIRSVGVSPVHGPFMSERWIFRGFAERRSYGSTLNIQTFSHYSV